MSHILFCVHIFLSLLIAYFYHADRTENTASNISSIVAGVFIAAGTCLPSHCLETLMGYSHTHRQQGGDLISLLLFFLNKESSVKLFQMNLLFSSSLDCFVSFHSHLAFLSTLRRKVPFLSSFLLSISNPLSLFPLP
jgi:hypothetical protein